MKYYIIGPSCSGKTTFSKQLSDQTHIGVIHLDSIYFDFHVNKKGKILVSLEEIKNRLALILKNNDWIIEGIATIPELLEQADVIIYLRASLIECLVHQWKRFFTDTQQRERYGIMSNIKLSRSIIRQFFEKTTPAQMGNLKYSRVSKSDAYCKEYANKVYILNNLIQDLQLASYT